MYPALRATRGPTQPATDDPTSSRPAASSLSTAGLCRFLGAGDGGEMDFDDAEMIRFQGKNSESLPLAWDGGLVIHLDREMGRLRLLLEIGEDATGKSLRAAIPQIMEWRRRLNRQQDQKRTPRGAAMGLCLI